MRILGTCDSHEANASHFVDDWLAVAVVEECLTRLKMEMRYPHRAIDFCLVYAGLKPHDLDAVVIVSEDNLSEQHIAHRIPTFSVDDFVRERREHWRPKLYEGFMEDRLLWHYRSPDREELERALAELEGSA